MKTIQITIEEGLLKQVDGVIRKLNSTRSAFIRQSLHDALQKMKASQQERRHREGYKQHPVAKGEFDVWENEQEWGD